MVKVPIYEGLPIPFDEFFTAVADTLGNGSRYPGWIMKFYIRVWNQVAVLFKVMRYTDHFPMSFDYKTVEVWHVEADMEVILRLKSSQQVMGLQ